MGRPKADLSESKWTVGTVELAHVFGVAVSRIRDFSAAGMPKRGRGTWHLPECVQWMIGRTDQAKMETELDVVERRAALYQAQEEHKRLEILKAARALLPVDEVERAILAYTAYFIGLLDALPGRTDLDPDAERRLEREILAARGDLTAALERLAGDLREGGAPDDTAASDSELEVGGEETDPS